MKIRISCLPIVRVCYCAYVTSNYDYLGVSACAVCTILIILLFLTEANSGSVEMSISRLGDVAVSNTTLPACEYN